MLEGVTPCPESLRSGLHCAVTRLLLVWYGEVVNTLCLINVVALYQAEIGCWQVSHLGIQWTTQVDLAVYPLWDSKMSIGFDDDSSECGHSSCEPFEVSQSSCFVSNHCQTSLRTQMSNWLVCNAGTGDVDCREVMDKSFHECYSHYDSTCRSNSHLNGQPMQVHFSVMHWCWLVSVGQIKIHFEILAYVASELETCIFHVPVNVITEWFVLF